MKLTNENIVATIEEIKLFCVTRKVDEQQCKRISLTMEEILLTLQSRFGSDAEYTLTKRSYFGYPLLRISLKGEPFDPLPAEGDDNYTRILRSLILPDDTNPTWKYVNGENRITVSVSKSIKSSILSSGSLLPAMLAAILFAFLCKAASGSVETFMLEDVLNPMFDAMMNLLILVTGPVIFLSLLTGIVTTDNLNVLKKTGGKIMIRFAALTIFEIAICIIGSILVFPREYGGSAAFDFGELLTLILSFIPDNIVSPFAENNLLQIVFLALISGIILIMLGDRVRMIKEFITQLNIFILRLMNAVSAIFPVLIFVSVAKPILENDLQDLAQIWRLVVLSFAVPVVIDVLLLAYLVLRRHINLRKFFRHIKPALAVAFSTASSTAAIDSNMKSCSDMGVDKNLTRLWAPLSHAVFSPSIVIPLILGTFFMADLYDVTVSFTWIATIVLLVFQIGFASSKVPGGFIALFSILFVQLGIPFDGIGLLTAASAILINFNTAHGMLVREIDIVDFASSIDSIDMEKFNS